MPRRAGWVWEGLSVFTDGEAQQEKGRAEEGDGGWVGILCQGKRRRGAGETRGEVF